MTLTPIDLKISQAISDYWHSSWGLIKNATNSDVHDSTYSLFYETFEEFGPLPVLDSAYISLSILTSPSLSTYRKPL